MPPCARLRCCGVVRPTTRKARFNEAVSDKLSMHHLPLCSSFALGSAGTLISSSFRQHIFFFREVNISIRRGQALHLHRTFGTLPLTYLDKMFTPSSHRTTGSGELGESSKSRHLRCKSGCPHRHREPLFRVLLAHRCFAGGRTWLWMMVRCACHGIFARSRLERSLQVGIGQK